MSFGPGNYERDELLCILDDALASVSAVEANMPKAVMVEGVIDLHELP